MARDHPQPHHHPTNAGFRIDTLGKPNDAYALRYVGRVVRVSRDCTRSPTQCRKNKRTEIPPSKIKITRTIKCPNIQNEIKSECNMLTSELTENQWNAVDNAGAIFSHKVVLFHATPALQMVPPMFNMMKALRPWSSRPSQLPTVKVSANSCAGKIVCIVLKSQLSPTSGDWKQAVPKKGKSLPRRLIELLGLTCCLVGGTSFGLHLLLLKRLACLNQRL